MANASGYWRERFSVLKMFKFNSFVAKLRTIFFEELSYKEEGK